MSEGWLVRALDWVERGRVSDTLVRLGIRALCRQRLLGEDRGSPEANAQALQRLVEDARRGPIAPVPEAANVQHYEVPAGFFSAVLGPRMKYSCCLWPHHVRSLAEAEQASLAVTSQRAMLADGQDVLELGCGWGSLTLWMADSFPHSRITAVSNSASQRTYIDRRASERGLSNVSVVTADMNDFAPGQRFDRVVSIEMFEHMRNYEELMGRVASWLVPDGRLFVHVFAHRQYAYPFETEGAHNWMGRHFFTGGLMPSDDLLPRFQRDLTLIERWRWSGVHYQKTAEAWLANLDASRDHVLPVLASVYGSADATRWLHRWRVFFLAVAELFGFRGGDEWGVSHYLFAKPAGTASPAPAPRKGVKTCARE